jgi:hypothetical protein
VATVQYRVVFGKKDEAVEGPDDASTVISVPVEFVGVDPTVLFMQGTLKATGDTGVLFDVLRSGEADRALKQLASRP